MSRSPLIQSTVVTGLGLLLVLNFMFSHLEHRTHDALRSVYASTESQRRLPSEGALRVLFGGFETLAADVVWIWSLVYYGEKRAQSRNPAYLEDYARTIVALDPYFHPVYRWFSTTYINSHHPPSHEDLERVERFLERGTEYFPDDHRLLKTAGLNYIGYSSDRPPDVRLEEVERAIELLERAAQHEGAPDNLPFTVAWLYQRKRQLERRLAGESDSTREETEGPASEQVEFFTNMYYLVDSASARQRIRSKLEQFGQGDVLLERGARYRRQLKDEHRRRFPYLPIGLWTTVITPTR